MGRPPDHNNAFPVSVLFLGYSVERLTSKQAVLRLLVLLDDSTTRVYTEHVDVSVGEDVAVFIAGVALNDHRAAVGLQ